MKLLLVSSAALLAAGGFLWLGQDRFLAGHDPLEHRGPDAIPQADEAGLALLDAAALAGFTPVSACVAGVAPSEAAAALVAVRDSEHRDALASASFALDAAFMELERLDEIVSLGGGSEEVMADHAAARVAVTQARSEYDDAVAVLTQTVSDRLDGDAATLWGRVRANASMRVPLAYSVFDASQSEWESIELAFRRFEAAQAQEEELDQGSAAILQTVESDGGVIAAAARLDSGLAAMEAAFAGVE